MSSTARLASSHEPPVDVVEAELLAAAVDEARRVTPSSRTPGSRSSCVEQAPAGLGDRRAASTPAAAVTERVIVVKSPKRTLSVTVRADQRLVAQAAGDRVGLAHQLALELLPVVRSLGEGLLVADRLERRGRARPPGRRAPQASAWRWRPWALPTAASSDVERHLGQLADRRDAEALEPARVAGPTPQSAATGSGWRKASSSPGRHTTTPRPGATPAPVTVGLAASEASLASSFDGATPMLHVSCSSSAMACGGRRRSPRPGRTAAARPSRRGRPRRGRWARRAG